LYLLALGINKYRDPTMELTVPVADAQAVVETFSRYAQGLYEVQTPVVLTDEKATPEAWRQALQRLGEQIRGNAQPDDLLVIFLAGHGVRDAKSGKYYFAGHGFSREDYRKGNYASCISWDDFRLLADVPCRKLALLDTCHAGAIQPPSQTDKFAARGLQDAMIFTITAAKADQVSAEEEGKHGLFTFSLLRALEGRGEAAGPAATSGRVVSLHEAVQYVMKAVPGAFEKIPKDQRPPGQDTQEPVAAPVELLPFADQLPLTRIEAASNGR
jgi:uncharacterized caspase-like protein